MTGKELIVRFILGSDDNYARNQSLYANGIYFATDALKIYLDGKKYSDARREMPVVDTLASSTEYFLTYADLIISGKYPNVVQVCDHTRGTGVAMATYEDNKNFRVDAYLSTNDTLTSEHGARCHTYIIYTDGKSTGGWLSWDYQYLPMLKAPKPDKTFHDKYFKGLNEAWIDSDGGEIIKHYWGGTAYINTVLPTSKELSSETICKYTYSFGSTPTITFGPDSVVAASTFTLKRVSLNNIQTQLFCTDSWVVKNGKLLTYSSGSRPMLLLNQNGGDLEVGEQVKIDCSNTDLIDETQTTGFTWEYTDNVYTLTKTYEGRLFIYLNRNMYITSISYYEAGTAKTFTVSTPSGVKEIKVLNDPNGAVNRITTLENKFPVNTSNVADKAITGAKIADSTITKDNLAFTVNPGILLFDDTGRATLYFLVGASKIIAGEYPNICMVKADDGIGYAIATYKDAKNFRVDYYSRLTKEAGIAVDRNGELYRSYILYEDGNPSGGWITPFNFDIYPTTFYLEDKHHVAGQQEFAISYKDGVLCESYWNGKTFARVLLPTSKDLTDTGTIQTFTISTPSGVKNINVLSNPSSVVNSVNTIQNKFPLLSADISSAAITTDKIADKAITKEKLSFDISGGGKTDVYWFNGTTTGSTVSGTFPSGAAKCIITSVLYDTKLNMFVANATFSNASSQSVGTGTYKILDGLLVTAIGITSAFEAPDGAPNNSTPESNVVYAQTPALLSIASANLYYYSSTKKTLVEFIQDATIADKSITGAKLADNTITEDKLAFTVASTAETVANINSWISSAFN